MPYTPDNLIIDAWASPITIVGSDFITNLDETVNDIISDDANSLKAFVNAQLGKIPAYLSAELVKVDANAVATAVAATAASAAAALASEQAAAADLALTNADVVLTHADAVSTAADAAATALDKIAAEAAAAQALADRLLTNADAAATAADKIATAADVVTAQGVLVSINTVFDNFDDRFLGAKASDPATDNDGDPLSAGVIYWNTTDSAVKFYNGAAWEAPSVSATASAAAALASQNAAAASAVTSETHKNKSQKWAEELEDVEVETGKYSALHWAAKAAATVANAINDAITSLTTTWSSTKIAAQLALKANLVSPNFTGTPTAPTPTQGDNSTKIATTAFVLANSPAPTTAEVLNATAGLTVGEVGSYALLASATPASTITAGTTYAGSGLRYASFGTYSSTAATYAYNTGFGAAPSGTWRALGRANHTVANVYPTTLFVRIA